MYIFNLFFSFPGIMAKYIKLLTCNRYYVKLASIKGREGIEYRRLNDSMQFDVGSFRS